MPRPLINQPRLPNSRRRRATSAQSRTSISRRPSPSTESGSASAVHTPRIANTPPLRAPPRAQRGSLSRRQWLEEQAHNQLRPHLAAWRRITKDKRVLRIVERGLRLELHGRPALRRRSPTFAGTPDQNRHLSKMLSQWLEAGLIAPDMSDDLFIHLLFPVPKPGPKKWRWCLDVSPPGLNAHLKTTRFKMTGLPHLRQLVQPHDWMCKLDLQDAYNSVLIDPSQQKLLGFKALNQTFRWRAMVFGISVAPKVFTDLIKPVLAQLHKEGIRAMAFLDDFFICARTPTLARAHAARAAQLLQDLGLRINFSKSELEPTQLLVYLGVQIDSRAFSLSVPLPKLEAASLAARKVLLIDRRRPVPVRRLAALAGILVSFSQVMPAAHARRHALHKLVQFALRRCRSGSLNARWRNASAHLSATALASVRWMSSSTRLQTANSHHPVRVMEENSLILTSDASDSGWGATLDLPAEPTVRRAVAEWLERGSGGAVQRAACARTTSTTPTGRLWPLEAAGFWPTDLSLSSSINVRESLAVRLALDLWADHVVAPLINLLRDTLHLPGVALVIKSDNSTTVSYLRKWGGRHKHLALVLQDAQRRLLAQRVPLLSLHLPGVDNSAADALSRQSHLLRHEWELSPDAVGHLLSLTTSASTSRTTSTFDVDWFAQPHNAKATMFATRWPDPRATFLDAFAHSWRRPTSLQLWTPPFPLVSRVVAKVDRDQASGWLVVPFWPTMPWFGALMALPRRALTRLPSTWCRPASMSSSAKVMRDGKAPPLLAVWVYHEVG